MAGSFARRKVYRSAQIGEESKAARACFAEQGLEAALRYLDMLPEGDPRDQFYRPVPCRTVDGRGGAGTACAAEPDVVQDGIADDGGRLGAVPA